MSDFKTDLEDWHNIIQQSGNEQRKVESDWFINNPPIKEFQIQRETGFVQYGVWNFNEDFLVFYKNSPEVKYNFMHKMTIEKEIVRELFPLLEKNNANSSDNAKS